MGTVEKLPNNKADHFPEEAREILKSLATQWDDVLNANELQVIPLKGALTNEVFQINWPTKTEKASRRVLVRIYVEGVDVFFDRDNERQTFEFMSKNGRGPRLLGQFANGRIEEFINALTLSASDLRVPAISGLIATKLKEFHDFNIPGPKKVHLWDRLRIWFSVAKRLSSPEEAESLSLDNVEEEISILEKELPRDNERIGFCHNDLQYGNILLDEGTNSVILIDYEYSSYNPVAYDIANHFCEMAANYQSDTPHILDYSKYPGLEERKKFVHNYLTSSGGEASDNEVEQLLKDIEKYTLANHLLWGLWGVISGHLSKIDFDYMEYAKQRFQQYWSSKYSVLGSVGSSPADVPNDKDKPSSDCVTENKPSATSNHTDKPSSSNGVTEDKPVPTTDKPSSDGVTSDKPVDKPSPAGVAADNPSPAGLAADKPSPAGVASDEPSSDGVTSDKPAPASVNSDKPLSSAVADDKPSAEGAAADEPSTEGAAADEPSTSGATKDDTSSVGTDGESSNAKGHNMKNASVFKRLKKYLTLSFLRQNKN